MIIFIYFLGFWLVYELNIYIVRLIKEKNKLYVRLDDYIFVCGIYVKYRKEKKLWVFGGGRICVIGMWIEGLYCNNDSFVSK